MRTPDRDTRQPGVARGGQAREVRCSFADGIVLVDNERSYVIQLISEINAYLAGGDTVIKRAGGESTINGGSFVKFPDVLLFSDAARSKILQGWEVKCPDVAIDDCEFVEDAHGKADLLGCNSCVLWNFQHAQLHVRGEDGAFEVEASWVIDERIVDRGAVREYEEEWKSFLRKLVDTVNEYVLTGRIKNRPLGDVLSESVMPAVINGNKEILSERLKAEAARNVEVSASIGFWWDSVRGEYAHDERDPFKAYAKSILVSWLNKFMFANLIQNRHDAARQVADIVDGCGADEALDIFRAITSRCDYRNIFTPLEYENMLPDATWEDLVAFNQLLRECKVDGFDSEYSHHVLQECVSEAKRQIAGQYPTPEPLASLMGEIAVRDAYGDSWDCCCGTGTVGCATWARKVQLLKSVVPNPEESAYRTTWMSDIHDFPLQVATQGFASLAPKQLPLLVFRANVFDVRSGVAIDIVDPATGNHEERLIPRFKSIVSNLPFVDFNTREIAWYGSVKSQMREECGREFGIALSDRNDLYCYIALHLANLLDDDGVACLLTSNSWLCTAAGDSFMGALRATFDVDAIYVNGGKRWFDDADVMNALLVLRKRKSGRSESMYMGVLDVGIDELADDGVRGTISRAIISHRGEGRGCIWESAVDAETMTGLKNLGLSYYSMCHGVSFMLELSKSLCRVNSLFEVARGIKSGHDGFFYSQDADFVEPEFRRALLKNFDEVSAFDLKPNWYAFCCDQPVEVLEERGCGKALSLIRSVANPNASCRGHRPFWYTLPESPAFDFATTMNPGGRLFFASASTGSDFVVNQRVICLASKSDGLDKDLCLALLNSTLGMFLVEASAAPMALGALDTRAETFSKMYMLNPSLLNERQRDSVVSAFEPLKGRAVMDALDELREEDRHRFDEVVLDAFGLLEYDQEIRRVLGSMLEARLRWKPR